MKSDRPDPVLNFRDYTQADRAALKHAFPESPLMQYPEYGTWHENSGREVIRIVGFAIDSKISNNSLNSEPVIFCQLIRASLRDGLTYLYAPYGPVTHDAKHVVALNEFILKHHVKKSDVFIRYDEVAGTDCVKEIEGIRPWKTSLGGAYFQPRAEWRLNIDPTKRSEKEILAEMHQKTRYSINLSLRKEELNVRVVTENLGARAGDFHKLMTVTAARDSFHLHPHKYYKNLLEALDRDKQYMPAYFIEISVGDTLVVMNLIIHVGSTAYYLFGTSSDEFRNLMPAYRAQWQAMIEARSRGAIWYNFGGISTPEFPHRGWDGITIFKQKFGGVLVTHSHTLDVPLRRIWYIVYIVRKYFLCLLRK